MAEQRGCQLSLVKRWSSRYRWRERAAAWQAHEYRDAVAETRAHEEAYDRRLRNAEQLEKVAMAGLRSLLVRDAESGELRFVQGLRPTEIASLIRVACQMLPTPPPVPEEREEDQSLATLSEAELLRLQTLLTAQTREANEDDTTGI